MKLSKHRVRQAIVAAGLAALIPLAIAPDASAAAAVKNVYAPVQSGTTASAWADLSHDCSGTMGCWNYMKIERKKGWFWWEDVGGAWVNNDGWNTVTADLTPGCHTYKTTVTSYNDIIVTDSTSTKDATTTSTGTQRLETTWSSAEVRFCR